MTRPASVTVHAVTLAGALALALTLAASAPLPFHGVPACTDAIADAGGICHGEP